MKRVAVIGGGLAGLSAAAYLANSGLSVELYEASPKLGGKAFSFRDTKTGNVVDNGQHILMGCYKETLQFFNLISSLDNLYFQKKLEVNFVEKGKGVVPLRSVTTLYPMNLILGILNFHALNIYERINILKLFFRLIAVPTETLNNLTVLEWLKNQNQSKKTLESFWEILVIAALNTGIKKASAKIFADILIKIFFKGNKAATIILPETGLSELYCNKAAEFIINNNGKINLSSRITSVNILRDKLISIKVNGEQAAGFNYFISAVPLQSFRKIFIHYPELKYENLEFNYSPILNVHIWLKENPLTERFYGLIDSPVHWIFNHKSFISVVISDAENLINMSNEEIFKFVTKEIAYYFPELTKESILEFKVIKEKSATFVPEPSVIKNRPSSKTGIKNLFLAGDWTDTRLPATIEGAVKSGKIAANLILNEI